MKNQLSESKERLKQKFIRLKGYWSDTLESFLLLDEKFFEKYVSLTAVPWKRGSLEPKVKELIYIAVNSATTLLHKQGIKTHIQNALKYGATKEEIMEVLQLTSGLGIHTCTVGVPILVDELQKLGLFEKSEFTGRKKELKERFIKERGYWAGIWDDLLTLDDRFFEAYLMFSAIPWKNGVLEPKIKEYIYIAFDVATTHLYEDGIRIHIQNALKYGANSDEIMELFEIVSELGIHSFSIGVPILMEEMEK